MPPMSGRDGKNRQPPSERDCPEGGHCEYELTRGTKDHNVWFGFWRCHKCGNDRMTIENDEDSR